MGTGGIRRLIAVLIAPLSNISGVSMMRRDFNQEDLIQQEAGSSIPLKKRSSSTERDALPSGVLEDGDCARIRSDDPLHPRLLLVIEDELLASGRKNMIPVSCGSFTRRGFGRLACFCTCHRSLSLHWSCLFRQTKPIKGLRQPQNMVWSLERPS